MVILWLPLVPHHSYLLSHEYSQATLFSYPHFKLYHIVSFQSCCLIWLAPEKAIGGKPHNLTRCVGAEGNRDTFKQVSAREAQNNMGGECLATENERILICCRAVHVGYTS